MCGRYFDFDTLKIPPSCLGVSKWDLCCWVVIPTGWVPLCLVTLTSPEMQRILPGVIMNRFRQELPRSANVLCTDELRCQLH